MAILKRFPWLTFAGNAGKVLAVNVGETDFELVSAGGVSDGDKGDITVSGSGSTWTIDNGVVTEAKQVLADNTTHNVSTSMHGYVPKATGETTKYLRADGGWETISSSLPDMVITKYAPALDQTITAGYCAYYSGYYEIADTMFLEIGVGSTLEIG